MRNAKAIYLKELRSYFNSPMAYIFLVIFAVLSGYFFTSTFFLIGQSDMRALFNIVPLVYLFFRPGHFHGSGCEGEEPGNHEVLSTMPIQDVEFVAGKIPGVGEPDRGRAAVYAGALLTLLAVGTHVDIGAAITGYVGLVLVGAFYAAVGTFASSLTENQVVSLIIAIAIVMLFFLLDKLLLFIPAGLATIAQYVSVDYHLSNIARGVVDSRNLIYFAGMIWLFLALTLRVSGNEKVEVVDVCSSQ